MSTSRIGTVKSPTAVVNTDLFLEASDSFKQYYHGSEKSNIHLGIKCIFEVLRLFFR